MSELKELTKKAQRIIEMYKEEYPDVQMDRDYLPFKISEEWGECLQVYLMLTDRGRQKGKTKDEITEELAREIADVFGYLIAFAENEGVDIERALKEKWFSYLDEEEK